MASTSKEVLLTLEDVHWGNCTFLHDEAHLLLREEDKMYCEMHVGRSLQSDFQNNQRRFWRRVRAPKRGSQEVDKICDGNGQVIGEEDGVMERWKEYFSGLLQGGAGRGEPKESCRFMPNV